jgi:diaminopimelate decarboxylase
MITCDSLVYQPFRPAGGALACDGVSIQSIVERAGTPTYIYSARAIREGYRGIDDAFASYPHAIHYALKANSTLAIARLLRSLGSRVDANSGGEIAVAERAGFAPHEIVFTGVGKTREELEYAIGMGVGAINAESAGELDRIASIAHAHGRIARVALRVNPDIDARSHPHISTGLRTNKFGVPHEAALDVYRRRRDAPGLEFVGVHVHVGSQITSVDPLRRAARLAVDLGRTLVAEGIRIEHVDVGGGLGVSYDGSPAPTLQEYAQAVLAEMKGSGLAVAVEPGRAIVAQAGALVARVTDTKTYPGARHFGVLDAGMTELMRPALYGAFHRIEPVDAPRPGPPIPYDIVGPICESSDVFARERPMPELRVGDLVAVLDTGAYGSAMASTYNRRPLAPEVVVENGRWRVIRRRQTIEEMLELEE